MVTTKDIQRPSRALIEKFNDINSATASAELRRLGIRDAFISGPFPFTPGTKIVGPALTLQFMPLREDMYPEGEYRDPELQLHRHCLYHTQPVTLLS